MQRRVQDVMTRDVVTVTGSAGFKDMVELLREHQISALPVVDGQGRLLGIVSETDLLLRQEQPRPHGRPTDPAQARRERTKLSARTAAELMTTLVVTVAPEATVSEAARLLHDRNLKRLPVVDPDGKLVGIVSRLDLLGLFLRSDEDIRRDVVEALFFAPLRIRAATVTPTVERGHVRLNGQVARRSAAGEAARIVLAVDGVVGVDNRLTWAVDDLAAGGARAPGPPLQV